MIQLSHDWLDALAVFVRAGRQDLVHSLYHNSSIQVGNRLGAYHINNSEITVDAGIFDLPHVERVEIMTSAAAQLARHFGLITSDDHEALCKALGCCLKHTGTVRERWRLIVVETDPRFEYIAESLVAKMYEDRPLCGWCKGPISTGSKHPVRTDLHEGCYDYIMQVVRPQLQKAREAEKAAYSGGSNG